MREFLLRAIVSAIAISVTSYVLPGIHLNTDNILTVIVIGIVFGIINGIIRPVMLLLSCPLVLVTLGLFIFVVNGLMLQLTAWIAGDAFNIDGLGWAILGGIIMSIVSLILEGLIGVRED